MLTLAYFTTMSNLVASVFECGKVFQCNLYKQETSFKKITVEGVYMWKNWFCVRNQHNWVQVWNSLNGGNFCRKVKKHDKN